MEYLSTCGLRVLQVAPHSKSGATCSTQQSVSMVYALLVSVLLVSILLVSLLLVSVLLVSVLLVYVFNFCLHYFDSTTSQADPSMSEWYRPMCRLQQSMQHNQEELEVKQENKRKQKKRK